MIHALVATDILTIHFLALEHWRAQVTLLFLGVATSYWRACPSIPQLFEEDFKSIVHLGVVSIVITSDLRGIVALWGNYLTLIVSFWTSILYQNYWEGHLGFVLLLTNILEGTGTICCLGIV